MQEQSIGRMHTLYVITDLQPSSLLVKEAPAKLPSVQRTCQFTTSAGVNSESDTAGPLARHDLEEPAPWCSLEVVSAWVAVTGPNDGLARRPDGEVPLEGGSDMVH